MTEPTDATGQEEGTYHQFLRAALPWHDAARAASGAHLSGLPLASLAQAEREFVASLAIAPTYSERYANPRRIDAGGQGSVDLVHDARLGRQVAKKSPLARDGGRVNGDAEVLGRFLREARVTTSLDHPGIVPVYDIGLDDTGCPYFTMKYVEGQTLATVLGEREQGASDWAMPRLVEVMLKVCDTVAAAHRAGIVHRDLSPRNVMIGAFGVVHVIDWGLARISPNADEIDVGAPKGRTEQSSAPRSQTLPGSALGTLWYMSPEQAVYASDEVGPWSDVYSLGAILYEVLSGKPPYYEECRHLDVQAVLDHRRSHEPASLHSSSRRAPPELVAICERAMARAPQDRFQDVQELAAELRAFLDGRAVKCFATGPWVEGRLWWRRNRALGVTATLGLIVAFSGALSILLLQQDHQKVVTEERNAALEAQKAAEAARQQALESLVRARAASLRNTARLELERDPELALTLACESVRRDPSPDGKQLLLEALIAARRFTSARVHSGPVLAMALSPDESELVTAGSDGTVCVLDASTLEVRYQFPSEGSSIVRVLYAPRGRHVAVDDEFGRTRVLGLDDHREWMRLEAPLGDEQRYLSSDGSCLVTVSPTGFQRAWDVSTGKEVPPPHFPTLGGRLEAICRAARTAVVSLPNGAFVALDLERGIPIGPQPLPVPLGSSLALASRGRILLAHPPDSIGLKRIELGSGFSDGCTFSGLSGSELTQLDDFGGWALFTPSASTLPTIRQFGGILGRAIDSSSRGRDGLLHLLAMGDEPHGYTIGLPAPGVAEATLEGSEGRIYAGLIDGDILRLTFIHIDSIDHIQYRHLTSAERKFYDLDT
jgi:serine/threonine protein kinase